MADQSKDLVLARQEYEAIVKHCAENDLPMELTNRHIEHAVILFTETLKRARSYVDIFTGKLPELFFKEIEPSISAALDHGASVTIVTIFPTTEGSGIGNMTQRKAAFAVHCIREELRDSVARTCPHFYVSDGKRFRLEKIHPKDQDFATNPEVTATASFNQSKIAIGLHQNFAQLLTLCAPTVS